jgi:hypothetical protein
MFMVNVVVLVATCDSGALVDRLSPPPQAHKTNAPHAARTQARGLTRRSITECFFMATALQKNGRGPRFNNGETTIGNPAAVALAHFRPEALRPCLSTGLPSDLRTADIRGL